MKLTYYFKDKHERDISSIEHRFDEYRPARTEPLNDEAVYEALSKHLAYVNKSILELRQRIHTSLERMKKREVQA